MEKLPCIITDKDGKFYRILDVFLTDDQKNSVLASLMMYTLPTLLSVLNGKIVSHFIPQEDSALEGLKMISTKIDGQWAAVGFEKGKLSGVLYRPQGFWSEWHPVEEKDISPDIQAALLGAKPRQVKRILRKLVKLKAFW
jgi:hypothetical protein